MSGENGSQTANNGRQPNGQFAAGNKGGPGRKPGRQYDLIHIAKTKAERDGMDMEEALWETLQQMIEKAKEGDTNAAKLVWDRLCGPVGQKIEVGQDPDNPITQPVQMTESDQRKWLDRAIDVCNEQRAKLDGVN